MSSENSHAEVAARWAESMRRGDLAEELWDPDLEIVNAEGWVIETTYRGHDGLRRWWNDLDEAFSELTLEFEEITPLDGEHVLTVQRLVGRLQDNRNSGRRAMGIGDHGQGGPHRPGGGLPHKEGRTQDNRARIGHHLARPLAVNQRGRIHVVHRRH